MRKETHNKKITGRTGREEQKMKKVMSNLIARNSWQNESGEISVLIYLSVFVVVVFRQLNFSNSCATN